MIEKMIKLGFMGVVLVVSVTVMNSVLRQTRQELGIDNITTTESPVNTTSIPDIGNPTVSIILLVTILIAVLVVAFVLWKRKGRSK